MFTSKHMIKSVHHIAIICSDYEASKHFYTHVLGLRIVAENFRAERNSWKLDLALGDRQIIELFSFPDAPRRLSMPEACGLRHLAFAVNDIEAMVTQFAAKGIACEGIRIDPYTGKRFTFFPDPDDLPIELYEG